MIKENKIGKCMIFLILIILLSSNVLSLGVTPARKIVNFEPGLEGGGSFKVLNSENKDIKVAVYVEDLFDGATINIENPEILFAPNEETKEVRYTYKLPQSFAIPGQNKAKIILREIPKDSSMLEGAVIGGSVAVVHQFRVDVPYPGKYAIPELRVVNTGRTDQIDFSIALNNHGKEDIYNAVGVVEIYNAINNEKVKTLESESFSVKSDKRGNVGVVWKDDVEFGKYIAKLTVTYDGETAVAEREFTVGKSMVEILYIYAKDFKLGDIAKFNILVENKWPDKIKDVYTEFFISQLGKEIATFKSATDEIEGSSTKELVAYWDTEGIEAGDYDAKIVLNYNGEKVEIDVKTIINMNSIIFEGISGAVVGSQGFVNQNFLFGAILLVVLTSLFWFVYFKFKRKKK